MVCYICSFVLGDSPLWKIDSHCYVWSNPYQKGWHPRQWSYQWEIVYALTKHLFNIIKYCASNWFVYKYVKSSMSLIVYLCLTQVYIVLGKMKELMPNDTALTSSTIEGSIRWSKDDAYAIVIGKLEHYGHVQGVPGALARRSSSRSTMPSLHS